MDKCWSLHAALARTRDSKILEELKIGFERNRFSDCFKGGSVCVLYAACVDGSYLHVS